MGYYLIKAAKDEDLYVEWSSIAEAPCFAGTRQETAEYLLNDHHSQMAEEVEQRLTRADRNGSSMLDNTFEFWDDPGVMAEQRWLRRDLIGAFSLLYLAGDEDGARAPTEDPE